MNYTTLSGFGWATQRGSRGNNFFCGKTRPANWAGAPNGARQNLDRKIRKKERAPGVTIFARAFAIPQPGFTRGWKPMTNLRWGPGRGRVGGTGSGNTWARVPYLYN